MATGKSKMSATAIACLMSSLAYLNLRHDHSNNTGPGARSAVGFSPRTVLPHRRVVLSRGSLSRRKSLRTRQPRNSGDTTCAPDRVGTYLAPCVEHRTPVRSKMRRPSVPRLPVCCAQCSNPVTLLFRPPDPRAIGTGSALMLSPQSWTCPDCLATNLGSFPHTLAAVQPGHERTPRTT